MSAGFPMATKLFLQLDDPRYSSLTLPKPLDASTWTAQRDGWDDEPLAKAVLLRLRSQAETTYISVAQDDDGQHRFVRFSDALAAKAAPLALLSEAVVKRIPGNSQLFARPELFAPQPAAPAAAPVAAGGWDAFAPDSSLAPHGFGSNYSLVPWLSVGPHARVILCDESTLTRSLPEERILDHVTLVVNCHEAAPSVEKYKCGRERGPPEVIAHAVHQWWRDPSASVVEKNSEIQKAMWRHLQAGGSVAVHCLAGIHRAACIVACHFLYRHHALGQREVPHEPRDVYKKLQSVRPMVSPAYEHVLQDYQAHLIASRTPDS